jgi:hypothetical protein
MRRGEGSRRSGGAPSSGQLRPRESLLHPPGGGSRPGSDGLGAAGSFPRALTRERRVRRARARGKRRLRWWTASARGSCGIWVPVVLSCLEWSAEGEEMRRRRGVLRGVCDDGNEIL